MDFRQECRKFADGWISIQREEFKRLGVTGNWENPYLTMDFKAERTIAREFMKFLMNGTLYQGSKPVMWSPIEKTALAEAEIEYHDKESFTIWVKFKVTDNEDTELNGSDVVIWTTTPWTIPSNKAVVFGPDIKYGLYEVIARPDECWANIGDRYILADNLAAGVMEKARLDETMYRRLRDVSVESLTTIKLRHPLFSAKEANGEWDEIRDFRPADFVTDTEGTGFVHCAPSHGMEEYELYRELGMLDEVITYNVKDDGSFRDNLPFFGGKYILSRKGGEGDANKAVIDKLIEVGGLLARGKIKHSYPHSWRSKAPVIYRNTAQWFVSMDSHGLRDTALSELAKTTFYPVAGQKRLTSMIDQRPDWCLSRQRAWGVPLTIFVNKETGEPLRDPAVHARVVAAIKIEGAACWFASSGQIRAMVSAISPT